MRIWKGREKGIEKQMIHFYHSLEMVKPDNWTRKGRKTVLNEVVVLIVSDLNRGRRVMTFPFFLNKFSSEYVIAHFFSEVDEEDEEDEDVSSSSSSSDEDNKDDDVSSSFDRDEVDESESSESSETSSFFSGSTDMILCSNKSDRNIIYITLKCKDTAIRDLYGCG